jgi:hypothetical protein
MPQDGRRSDAQERLLAIGSEYTRWQDVVGHGIWGPADCVDPHIARQLAVGGPRADGFRKSISHGDSMKLAYYCPLFRPDHQVSTNLRFPSRAGAGTDRRPRPIHARVSAGSITASISSSDPMLIAFPRSYAAATIA